ncbi:protein hairy-like [Penaeus chinensis]|uniref:protein hairy-like n=1 Tax=Penaeus chinensis TaxID=139456 RepID=UPI001FB5DE30|nr:protein hairy-like [Penaeus chinensis]
MGVPEAPYVKVKTPKPVTEGRRIRKPIMEKKRRDRINSCLDELSALLQEERMVKAKTGKAAKLEKADVLELTVRYWQSVMGVRTRGSSPQLPGESGAESGYLKGYKHCISMVDSLLGDCKEGGTETFREGLLKHLSERVQILSPGEEEKKSEGEMDSDLAKASAQTTSGGDTQSLALIPTLLPDGALALLLQEGFATTAYESHSETEDEQTGDQNRPSLQLKPNQEAKPLIFPPMNPARDANDALNPRLARSQHEAGESREGPLVMDSLDKQYKTPTADSTDHGSPMEEGLVLDGTHHDFGGATPMDTCSDLMWRPW